jgi:hypothetical protein
VFSFMLRSALRPKKEPIADETEWSQSLHVSAYATQGHGPSWAAASLYEKVKFFRYLTKCGAMQTYGASGRKYPRILNIGARLSELLASRPGRFTPDEGTPSISVG